MSYSGSSRWVAKKWRNVWQLAFLFMPASRIACNRFNCNCHTDARIGAQEIEVKTMLTHKGTKELESERLILRQFKIDDYMVWERNNVRSWKSCPEILI